MFVSTLPPCSFSHVLPILSFTCICQSFCCQTSACSKTQHRRHLNLFFFSRTPGNLFMCMSLENFINLELLFMRVYSMTIYQLVSVAYILSNLLFFTITDQEYEVHKMLGYPRPLKRDMILVNSFGQPFDNVYGKDVRRGVWKLLKKRVSKGISRNVVSLASFNGNTSFFACTGFFIEWDDKCRDNNVSTILTCASLVRVSDPFDGENKVIDGLRLK